MCKVNEVSQSGEPSLLRSGTHLSAHTVYLTAHEAFKHVGGRTTRLVRIAGAIEGAPRQSPQVIPHKATRSKPYATQGGSDAATTNEATSF
jgi:hypothetical protein